MAEVAGSELAAPPVPAVSAALAYLARVIAGLCLSGLSVLLLVLALPPTAAWPLVLVAGVPMLVAQHRVLPAPLAGLAPGLFIGGSSAVLITEQINRVPPYLSAVPVVLGIFFFVGGWVDRWLQSAGRYRWFVLAAPLLVVGIDVLGGRNSLASTEPYPAYAFFAHPSAVQPVSVFSTDALNLLIVVTNYAVALLLLNRVRLSTAARWAGAVAVAWAGWMGLGAALTSSTQPSVKVAAVQVPGVSIVPPSYPIPRSLTRSPALAGDLDQLVAQTRVAAGQGARLVVWHETQLVGDPGPVNLASAQAVARSDHVYLVTGLFQPGLNQAVTIDPDGRVLGIYGKQHPVTFLGDRSEPTPVPVYRTPAGTMATIICYDLDFLDTSRQAARHGARIVAVPSSDWGKISGVHYTHLVFRAVENRLAMVKSDAGFDSAVIDPYGRVLSRSVTSQPTESVQVRDVPLGSGRTVAQLIQPWFAPAALILGLAIYAPMLFAALRPYRRLLTESRAWAEK